MLLLPFRHLLGYYQQNLLFKNYAPASILPLPGRFLRDDQPFLGGDLYWSSSSTHPFTDFLRILDLVSSRLHRIVLLTLLSPPLGLMPYLPEKWLFITQLPT